MATRRRHVTMLDIARRLHRRLRELHADRPGTKVKKYSAISRILEHDQTYEPYRERRAQRRKPLMQHPSIFTMIEVADELQTTVGALIGEGSELTASDLKRIGDIVDYLESRFLHRRTFVIGEYEYPEPYDPQPVATFEAEAGTAGRENSEFEPEREPVHGDVPRGCFVIRVRGDSMANLITDGTSVMVDTSVRRPRNDDIVAVYRRDEGGVIGYWREERGRCYLEKENPGFKPIALGDAETWRIHGVITEVVRARLKRPRRPPS
jgi:hypothetical protein